MENKLSFYEIKNEYVNYLKIYDSKICTLNYLTTIEDINITFDCFFDSAELVAKEFIEKK